MTQPRQGNAFICTTMIDSKFSGKYLPCISKTIADHSFEYKNNLPIGDSAKTNPLCNISNSKNIQYFSSVGLNQ